MRCAITKEFKFEAAHSIPHHEGKCRELHGHSYRVEVEVVGTIKTDGPEAGMVCDFARLSDIWRTNLEPLLDHKNINETLHSKIPFTTAELIASFIYGEFIAGVPVDVRVESVRVWETATSSSVVGNLLFERDSWARADE